MQVDSTLSSFQCKCTHHIRWPEAQTQASPFHLNALWFLCQFPNKHFNQTKWSKCHQFLIKTQNTEGFVFLESVGSVDETSSTRAETASKLKHLLGVFNSNAFTLKEAVSSQLFSFFSFWINISVATWAVAIKPFERTAIAFCEGRSSVPMTSASSPLLKEMTGRTRDSSGCGAFDRLLLATWRPSTRLC